MIDPAILETVSVPLALEDAVPVLLSTAGMVAIARGVGHRLGGPAGLAATLGALLIGLGGLTKVTWKVVAAGFERDLTGVDDLLFPFLAVGFCLLTVLVIGVRHRLADPARRVRSLGAGAFGLAVGIASLVQYDVDLGLRFAMAVAVVGSLTLSWHLIQIARANDLGRAASFLVVNVVATLVLSGMARIETQTLALQWIEQSINTISQGLFLWAALRLSQEAVTWTGRDSRVSQPASAA